MKTGKHNKNYKEDNPLLCNRVKAVSKEEFYAKFYSDYDIDEDGNMLSCCGDILDPDNMICKTCKEHC